MSNEVVVVDHPVVQHKLTFLRMKETSTRLFRDLLGEIGMLLAYEVTRDLPLERCAIETPLGPADSFVLGGKKVVLVSILRAGQGLLDGMLRVLPSARVGHIGLYRDHDTLEAIQYYAKLPREMSDRLAIVIDPMLATGHSAIAAVRRVKETRPKAIKFVCLVAAPEGLEAFRAEHPGVPVYTAAIDERLNDQGYIVPGLGDAGDRIFGTR